MGRGGLLAAAPPASFDVSSATLLENPRPGGRRRRNGSGGWLLYARRSYWLLLGSYRYRPGRGRRHPLRNHRECALTARREQQKAAGGRRWRPR